jgi:hypothetical protein
MPQERLTDADKQHRAQNVMLYEVLRVLKSKGIKERERHVYGRAV